MYKTRQVWTTFGSCDVENVHAVVFWSQNFKSTPRLDHFLDDQRHNMKSKNSNNNNNHKNKKNKNTNNKQQEQQEQQA
jgi:hypothetical protein